MNPVTLPPLTSDQKEAVYREVLRDYRLQDAKAQWEMYAENHGLPELNDSQLNELVDMYEHSLDCNIAENDLWGAICWDYHHEGHLTKQQ